MPYPSEHACRLREPAGFQDGSFRRTSRKHDGKTYDVIMGRLKGSENMTEQAYRYPKGSWSESEARGHCSSHSGKTFEPATKEQAVELPMLTRDASFRALTADDQSRTVELTWTTGAVVRRRGFFGPDFDEELDLGADAVRLGRLNSGANLIDSHQSRQLDRILGVVERAWIEGVGNKREGRAVVRFSEREDVEPVWRDVKSGIIRNVSVGYAIHRAETIERRDDVPLMRAIDWEPHELSLVAVPADARAQVRSGDESRVFPCIMRTIQMDDQATSAVTTEVADHKDPQQPETERKPDKGKVAERKSDATEQRAEPKPNGDARAQANGHEPAAPVIVQTGPTESEIQARIDAAIAADHSRAKQIGEACRVLKLEPEIGQRLIAEKVAFDMASSALFAEAAKRDQARQIVERTPVRIESSDQDEETIRARSITSSLLHRFNPEVFKLEANANRYVGFSLLELGRHCLEAAGVRTVGMHKGDVAERALLPGYGIRGAAGYHTTSDFANVLADVANKTLRQAYEEAPRTFTPIARRATAPDFKTINRNMMGELPTLAKVNEHGEYKRVTMSDAKESYALATYGAVFAVTRKVIINDDLDAFTRIPQKFGASAARTESDVVWGVITANAAMSDGTALFHANHGNLKASGSGPPSVATVGLGRASMRVQKGLDGALINVQPRFMVVPAALETAAEQFLTAVTYVGTATPLVVTPESLRASLTLIVEPRLDANSLTAWYLFASPTEIDTLEYAYLEGQQGVNISTRTGFDIDGVEIKASLDFASKAIDHRGMFKDLGTP